MLQTVEKAPHAPTEHIPGICESGCGKGRQTIRERKGGKRGGRKRMGPTDFEGN